MLNQSMSSSRSGLRPGFTLLELLVAMGIMIVLAGLLVPMLVRAYGVADRTRLSAQLATISTAIEAYRQDFGDIPRFEGSAGTVMPGANLLGLKLVGPLDATAIGSVAVTGPNFAVGQIAVNAGVPYTLANATTASGPTGAGWFQVPTLGGGDGVDGPGFKSPSRANNQAAAGPTRGAYIDTNRFTVQGTVILDAVGNPILYYPSRVRTANVRLNSGYLGDVGRSNGGNFVFNAQDNVELFVTSFTPNLSPAEAVARTRSIFGDTNANGIIDADETRRATGSFVLMSAGPDRQLGQRGGEAWPSTSSASQRRAFVNKLDDVNNFEN